MTRLPLLGALALGALFVAGCESGPGTRGDGGYGTWSPEPSSSIRSTTPGTGETRTG